MEDRAKKLTRSCEPSKVDTFDLDTLLHPASAFAHPMDVVRDADLTLNEKRARFWPHGHPMPVRSKQPLTYALTLRGRVVRWDEIMDALRILDGEAERYGKPLPHYKRVLASKSAGLVRPAALRSRKRDDEGRPLN
jgi:hypothetical protein